MFGKAVNTPSIVQMDVKVCGEIEVKNLKEFEPMTQKLIVDGRN